MAKAKEHKSRQQGRWNQGMTYCLKFTILYKDCLVMKKMSNQSITEADTNFSKMSPKMRFLRGFKRFCGKQNWHSGFNQTLSYSVKDT